MDPPKLSFQSKEVMEEKAEEEKCCVLTIISNDTGASTALFADLLSWSSLNSPNLLLYLLLALSPSSYCPWSPTVVGVPNAASAAPSLTGSALCTGASYSLGS